MALQQVQRFCKNCNAKTLHGRERFSDGWGCFLTIFTGGLFFPIWVLLWLLNSFKPWRCQQCGQRTHR